MTDVTDEEGRRGGVLLALVVVALIVNLPLAHLTWQRWELSRDGVEVSAEVTATNVLRARTDPHYVVRFRLPEMVDPRRRTWPAEVDHATWRAAEDTGEIGVRVLPDKPAVQRVEGARSSAVGYVVIGVVDLIVLLLGLLLWRQRRTPRATLPA
ncbi:hypothetical protein QI633_00330 [Nocardioides sp. QY071]|uniref:DUF3592 domain-containing protein n=1 Tax=Nocardioides sp. QY071 TaxID=3044187 RepID=UPI00249A7896|nr:DUF3592 domain-containing protein [Nocardioides sp. QY071]WGY02218.1 hypothetical protein QI633_00330 [Nocardioides sp. QY071]